MLYPLEGFAPDKNPTTPGVLTACAARVPSSKGMKAAPSAVSIGLPALDAACIGAATLTTLNGTVRFIAGTTTKLQMANASTWEDVSRTSGGAYNASADQRWRFAQFGDVSLAAQKGDILQYLSSGTDFANVGASVPKFAIIETVNQFVFGADSNDQGNLLGGGAGADEPNRWWCSAIGDYTDWTPAASTQCTSDVITSSPGAIRAMRRLGDGIVIYKERAMYLFLYVGPPVVWQPQEVSSAVGAQSQETVVPIVLPGGGPAHVFMGNDNFYLYDGSRPIPIGDDLKDWFFARLNTDFAYLSVAVHDALNSLVYFYYPSTSSPTGALDSCEVYNYRKNKWGVDDRTVEMASTYLQSGLTYASLEAAYATYGALPSISYGSPFWFAGKLVPAFFNSSHVAQTLTGTPGDSSYTTGDIGLDGRVSLLTRVRPRALTKPTTSQLTNSYRDSLGDSATNDTTVTLANNRFDVLRTARWHRLKVDDSGSSETAALDVEMQDDGTD